MKTKFILSIISFFTCFILFSALSFAWFALSDKATGEGAEYEMYDENVNISISQWDLEDWTEFDQKFANLGLKKPGDVIYLRYTFNRNDNSLNNIVSFKFKEVSSTVSESLFVKDNTICVKDLTNKDVKLYDLVDGKVLDSNGDVWLSYDSTTDVLTLESHKITDVIKLYIDDSLSDPNSADLTTLTAYSLNETVTINKSFDENGIAIVYFAIELNQAEIEDDQNDLSRYFAYQYFKLVGVDLVVE